MKINSLSLQNFRNIDKVILEFHPHLNILLGKNGSGKTNVIESIVFLSSLRSFRINDDKYMIKDEEEFAKVEASLQNGNDLVVILSNQGKYLRKNNVTLSKLSDFIGLCNVVLFSPDDMNFYTQTPSKRRKEIDYEIGKISKQYLDDLTSFNKLLIERNAYLKLVEPDPLFLDVLDEKMLDHSINIIKQRKEFVDYISNQVNTYSKTFIDLDNIQLEYLSIIDLDDNDIKEALKNKILESRERDLRYKQTHVGIHREDYLFKVNQIPIIYSLSQGQRRLLMVSFKLAVIDWFRKMKNIIPIFCMDDILSELDEEKRLLVLSLLDEEIQTFISTTDPNFIKTNKDKKVFNIHNGKIREAQLHE